MSELHDLLDRATDRVESPNLAARALAGARRRRNARRAVLASAMAVVVVVGVAGAGRIGAESMPEPAPSPHPTPDVRSRWDPRDVDDLPAAAPEVAPCLPELVEPPDSAPGLGGEPLDAAVLGVDAGDALLVLGTDGSWRSVPPPGEYGGAYLTRDGTRLAVETEGGVDVWDLPTGRRTHIPVPDGFREWDYASWRWVDRDTLLLDDAEGGWLVDAATGAAEEVAYPSDTSFYWTVDARGAVVESADWTHPDVLTGLVQRGAARG